MLRFGRILTLVCVVGLVMLGVAVKQRIEVLASGESAVGRIVAFVSGENGYRPQIRFTTAQGRAVTVLARFEWSANDAVRGPDGWPTAVSGYALGDPLRVFYPADRPESAAVDTFMNLWLVHVVIGGVLAAGAVAGGALWWTGVLEDNSARPAPRGRLASRGPPSGHPGSPPPMSPRPVATHAEPADRGRL
jgi:hypothetical protein